ncbi:MAG TPA: hypothetical protein PLG92_14340 [Piscinibacter sp.]|nr:hypothetical protein [Piscinibacter sp.]
MADTPKGDGQRAALITAAERTGLRVSLPRTDGARLPGAVPLQGELRWSDAEHRYRCGLMEGVAGRRTPWSRWARRLIAAGAGCDSDAELQ